MFFFDDPFTEKSRESSRDYFFEISSFLKVLWGFILELKVEKKHVQNFECKMTEKLPRMAFPGIPESV